MEWTGHDLGMIWVGAQTWCSLVAAMLLQINHLDNHSRDCRSRTWTIKARNLWIWLLVMPYRRHIKIPREAINTENKYTLKKLELKNHFIELIVEGLT